jgi:hypothetical protein
VLQALLDEAAKPGATFEVRSPAHLLTHLQNCSAVLSIAGTSSMMRVGVLEKSLYSMKGFD